jgi:hypothetical protein
VKANSKEIVCGVYEGAAMGVAVNYEENEEL